MTNNFNIFMEPLNGMKFEKGTDGVGIEYEYIFINTQEGRKEIRVYETVDQMRVVREHWKSIIW